MHLPLTIARRGRDRRVVAGVATAPALFVLLGSAGGGCSSSAPAVWLVVVALAAAVGAAILSTYVPLPGQRLSDAAGCAPCAAMSAMTVVGAAALLAFSPHQVSMGLVALSLVVLGLVRRRGATDAACPTP